jgi:FKBP-type peptidyl-prolyl cis-trans isomerase SlyD
VAKPWPLEMTFGMQVGPDTFVTLAYTLYDEDGAVVDRTDDEQPLSYLHGYGQLVPGLERGIEGMTKGDLRSVVVPASDGYGEYDPEAVFEVERSDFPRPSEVAVGDEFFAESDDGQGISLTVLEVHEDSCLVDTNHPLAGEDLKFDVTVLEVRAATDEEIRKAERALAPDVDLVSDLVTLGRKPRERSQPS